MENQVFPSNADLTGPELWDKLARGAKCNLDLGETAREEIESVELE